MDEREISAELVICNGRKQVSQVKLTDSVTIGRAAEGEYPEIQVESMLLEPEHGKLVKKENGYEYHDLGSSCGTTVNGNCLNGGVHELQDGDVLRIEADEASGDGETVLMIFQQLYDSSVRWRTIDLSYSGADVHISRHEEAAGESEIQTRGELPRHYATLRHSGSGWTVIDNHTMYGVFVNNQKVEGSRELKDMDVIRIGDTLFLFRGEDLFYNHKEENGDQLVIHIEERSVWNLFRKKILLEDIDLTIHPGELVLILGGSGAGKTTFVNAVMGYEKAKGTIMEGSHNVYEDYNQMKYEIGFVPQQDLLRGEDSVYETLNNAAELKMPKNSDKEERDARIEEVLNLFGLERERDELVEKLSGGQKKRLSISVEFIANPSLFFLDEPDSGLDGVMARALMEQLRLVADDGKIVIVITHSPDRAEDLFNKVVVLAKSEEDNIGHLAFFGTVEDAKVFFESESLEGIVRKINRKDEGGEGLSDFYIKKYEALKSK